MRRAVRVASMGVYEIRKVRIVLSGNDPQNSI